MKRVTITTGIGEAFDGTPLEPDFVDIALEQVRGYLAHEAGGFTEMAADGGWLHDDHVVRESAKRFVVIANDQVDEETLARNVARFLHQHSVALDAELARLKREGATIIRIVHDIA